MKKKVCTKDRRIIDGETCPLCGGSQFSESFNGRVIVVDPDKSIVAQKLGMKKPGEYAIKVK